MKNRKKQYREYYSKGTIYFTLIQFCKKNAENFYQMISQVALYMDGKLYVEQDGTLAIVPKARIIKAYNTMPSECSELLKEKYRTEIKRRYSVVSKPGKYGFCR